MIVVRQHIFAVQKYVGTSTNRHSLISAMGTAQTPMLWPSNPGEHIAAFKRLESWFTTPSNYGY